MTVDTRFGSWPDHYAKYVRPTRMANYDDSSVKKLANETVKEKKTLYQAISAIHQAVAELPLGFDREDLPASQILRKGRGQCNTKTTLFIALARAAGIPARIHAWKVRKAAHKSHMPWIVYAFTPKTTLFTYPEVHYKGEWVLLSQALRKRGTPDYERCPFDDSAARNEPLKKEWISVDLGSFWHPDTFLQQHGTNADGWRRLAFPIAQLFLNRESR